MRLDKFLKVSRIIKRRTLAADAAKEHHVYVNGRVAKPSYVLKVNDVVMIDYSKRQVKFEVLSIDIPKPKAEEAMYKIIEIIEK